MIAGGSPVPMSDSGRPNLLYVVHRTPFPPDKGDRIRAFHLLRHLSRQCAVHLAFLADEPVPTSTSEALHSYCARVKGVPLTGGLRWPRAGFSLACGRTISEGAFWSPRLASIVRGWAKETRFDACLASASSVAAYLRLPELGNAPAVVDLMDVDSQKWFDYAAASRPPLSWLYRVEGDRLRRLERSIAGWARAVTLVSEAEAELFSRICPTGDARAITNGVDLDYFRPVETAGAEDGCVFVGALDYRPNVDAACWFCDEAWPEIHRRRPGLRLRLVGRRPVPAVRRLGAIPGVEVVGQVPDVRPYLTGAAVAVNPLRIARGLQNKVLEAMAMGKAVIASPQALAGLGRGENAPVLCARTAGEWIEMVGDLLDRPEMRGRLGVESRRYVEKHHDWERCLRPFQPLLGLSGEGEAALSAAEGRA
jgi:sugar transferase (PEP-CTERM/EpsH1 system associated)